MYCIEHEILKQLSKFETVVDDTCQPTLDELKQIRNKIHKGLAFCKELYKKKQDQLKKQSFFMNCYIINANCYKYLALVAEW